MITKKITLDGIGEVEVKELAFGDIRNLLTLSEQQPVNGVDSFLDQVAGISRLEVVTITSLTGEQMDRLTPTEFQVLMAAVKEVNASFFAVRDRLLSMASKIPCAA